MVELKFSFKNFFQKYSIFCLILIFFAAYTVLAIGKHQRFGTSAADLGIYAQSVWHYSRIEAPFSSIKNLNQLSDHFNPTLALFTPFYWIWSNPMSLLVAQSLLVVLGVLPIFWLAKEKLSELSALVISLAYLFFVGIQSGIDFNFHPEVVAATWIGFAIYFLLKRKFLWYLVFALLALGSKEDIAPIFLGLGLYLILFKKWYKVGALTFIGSIFWFYLTTSILMPYFAGTPIHFLSFHAKATGFGHDLFFDQIKFFKTLTSPFDKIETVLTLFGSFAFISVASPLSWFTLPATFINRFPSGDWSRWSTHFQYSATAAPLLAISAILAIESLKRFFKKIDFSKVKLILLFAVLVGTIYANRPGWDYPFITPPLKQIFKRSLWPLNENQKIAHKIIEIIPPDASVTANTFYVPHLINREKIYAFPQVWEETEIYFLTTFNYYPDETLKKFEEQIKKLKEDERYELNIDMGDILLFKLKSAKI